MSSSSSRAVKSSQRWRLSTIQVQQIDESSDTQQSGKNPDNASLSGVKNGGISRSRSAASARRSRKSKMQRTAVPSQRSRSSLGLNRLELNGEDMYANEDPGSDNLNTSCNSTATENMDAPQQHDMNHSIEAIYINRQNRKNNNKQAGIDKPIFYETANCWLSL